MVSIYGSIVMQEYYCLNGFRRRIKRSSSQSYVQLEDEQATSVSSPLTHKLSGDESFERDLAVLMMD